jgi:hypothetical protein
MTKATIQIHPKEGRVSRTFKFGKVHPRIGTPQTDGYLQTRIDGKIVSLSDAQKAAQKARKEWEAKRATTHKQITRRKQGTQGNFKNNFETVWVKIW